MSRDRIQKRTKYLTVSAFLCALSLILLLFGSFAEVLDLSVAVLASVFCIYAVIEMGGAYPWMIWLVTSVLALLLLPQKTTAVFYALFAGYYPILKEKIEGLRRGVGILLKLVVFHGALGAIYLVFRLFLPAEMEESLPGRWMLLAIYAIALVAFWIYDYALTKLITLYLIKFRRIFRIK